MTRRPRIPTLWETPDALWERIKRILDAKDPPKPTGRPRGDQRRMLDGIIFRMRTGCQWNYIPKVYGDDSTIHRTFQKWVALGVFEEIWALLIEECAELGRIDWEWQAVDTMMGKARLGGTRSARIPPTGPRTEVRKAS